MHWETTWLLILPSSSLTWIVSVAALLLCRTYISLQKLIGCFNHWVATLVVAKLRRQWLWEIYLKLVIYLRQPEMQLPRYKINLIQFILQSAQYTKIPENILWEGHANTHFISVRNFHACSYYNHGHITWIYYIWARELPACIIIASTSSNLSVLPTVLQIDR